MRFDIYALYRLNIGPKTFCTKSEKLWECIQNYKFIKISQKSIDKLKFKIMIYLVNPKLSRVK